MKQLKHLKPTLLYVHNSKQTLTICWHSSTVSVIEFLAIGSCVVSVLCGGSSSSLQARLAFWWDPPMGLAERVVSMLMVVVVWILLQMRAPRRWKRLAGLSRIAAPQTLSTHTTHTARLLVFSRTTAQNTRELKKHWINVPVSALPLLVFAGWSASVAASAALSTQNPTRGFPDRENTTSCTK